MTNPSGPPTALDSLLVGGVPTQGIGGLPFTTGNVFFVNETTGSDGFTGTAQSPFKTLSQALAMCVANNNDTVCFVGTIHLTASLAWNKNQVHLVGICNTIKRGKRARISVSGTTAFSKLVNVSASGCHFANFGTFYGFNSASNNDICWYDSGGRNCYDGVEFYGFGDGTASTGTANITAARAFTLTGTTGECTFRSCVFGTDTTTRNATNYTLEIAGDSPRNYFYDCDFEAFLGASGGSACHLLIGSAGIDRYAKFINCRFTADVDSGGSTAMAQALSVSSSAGGTVFLDQCTTNGCTAIQTTPTTNCVMNMVLATTGGGKAHEVF